MMRKYLPWIIAFGIFALLGYLVITNRNKKPHRFDGRVTLKQSDKIPYGTSIARSLVPAVFPSSKVFYDNASPGNWDSIYSTSYNQAVIYMAFDFNADQMELQRILEFARLGNQVFIIAHSFSYDARKFFDFSSYNEEANVLNGQPDSLSLKLDPYLFETDQRFSYPGYRFETSFDEIDSVHCAILGSNREGRPNFMRIKAGAGNIFIHSAPLAFSNYFLLCGDNISYYRHVLSVIPASTTHIAWSEYYLLKPSSSGPPREPDMYRVLFRYPAFKWGLITAIALLGLLALLGSRRRQRPIPTYTKPRNDSLDFVKTLGRLYFDRGDHHNLARKMSVYFLDHVRHTYKLSTQTLDGEFVNALHRKSGYGEKELGALVAFINYLGKQTKISEQQLAQFHRQLELFYQNT